MGQKYSDSQLRSIYALGRKQAISQYSEYALRASKNLVEKGSTDRGEGTGKGKGSKSKTPVQDRQKYFSVVKSVKAGTPLSKALKQHKMGEEKFRRLNNEEKKLTKNPYSRRWEMTWKVDIPVVGGRIEKGVRVYEPEMRIMLAYWKAAMDARNVNALDGYAGVVITDVYGDTYTLSTDLKQARKHYSAKSSKSFPIVS